MQKRGEISIQGKEQQLADWLTKKEHPEVMWYQYFKK